MTDTVSTPVQAPPLPLGSARLAGALRRLATRLPDPADTDQAHTDQPDTDQPPTDQAGGASFAVAAPFTGETLARVRACTPAEVGEAFSRARGAQRGWAARPVRERARVLLRLHDLVLARQAEGLDLVQAESGKARRHAFEEIADTAIAARYYARAGAAMLRSRRRRGALPLLTHTVEHHHPRGVVGIIAPWNYPLSLGITDALPALLAGNAVVIKPDSQSVFTALWAAELLADAGLPEHLFTVVPGSGRELGPALIDAADYLCFTGSTATGRSVAALAAQRLIGCSLELGGKNAMIVLDDADLDKAVDGAVRACFASAGQLCISIERLLVAAPLYEVFTRRFAERAAALRLGAGLDFSADMGSLVSAAQLAAVRAHVDDAVAKGARVLAGGQPRPDIGPYFFAPTVLSEVTADMTLCAQETFGPVVSVYRFGSDAEALATANAGSYGLNASIWTRSPARGRALAAGIRAGTVNINEGYSAAWASIDAPMGGMGDSGLGRRHGREGLIKYTEAQTVAVQRLLPLDAPPGMGPERYAKVLSAALAVLRRTPGVR